MMTGKSCNLSEQPIDLPWEKVEPVEPVVKNIYQSNAYRKDLSWPQFYYEQPRVQEKQQVKD